MGETVSWRHCTQDKMIASYIETIAKCLGKATGIFVSNVRFAIVAVADE